MTLVKSNDYRGGLVERIPAGIYQADSEGIVTYSNSWAARIFGYESAEQLQGVNITSLYVKPKDREKLLDALSDEGASDNYRVEMVKQSGEIVIISVNTRYRTPGNPSDGVEGVFTDVTDLVSYERLFEELPVGVYQLDDDLNISRSNHGFEKVFGYERGELKGKAARILYKDVRDMDRLAEDLKERKGASKPEITSRVLEMKKKNGGSVWISLSTHLRRDMSGKIIGREGTVTETTLPEAADQKLISGYCYVALPFTERMMEIYYKTIKPAASEHSYIAMRANDIIDPQKWIKNKMLDMISAASFIVGDVTGENANVTYELGIAHAFGKHIILITQSEELPTNMRGHEFIGYEDSMLGEGKLKERLSQAIAAMRSGLS